MKISRYLKFIQLFFLVFNLGFITKCVPLTIVNNTGIPLRYLYGTKAGKSVRGIVETEPGRQLIHDSNEIIENTFSISDPEQSKQNPAYYRPHKMDMSEIRKIQAKYPRNPISIMIKLNQSADKENQPYIIEFIRTKD